MHSFATSIERIQEVVNSVKHFQIGTKAFPLTEVAVNLGSRTINLLNVPTSSDNLEDIVAERGLTERRWPYWLEEWKANFALGHFLLQNWKKPPENTLDLGCGNGFLGLLFHEMGFRLFACDFNEDACRLAALNLRSRQAVAQVMCADLSSFPSRMEFDLILMGDMLYARENITMVLDFLQRHLAAEGKALASDAGRSSAENFGDLAIARGFLMEKQAHHWPGMAGAIDIYILVKDSACPIPASPNPAEW